MRRALMAHVNNSKLASSTISDLHDKNGSNCNIYIYLLQKLFQVSKYTMHTPLSKTKTIKIKTSLTLFMGFSGYELS